MLAHCLISGFVQGVGYRQFTKKTAINLGLNGWVKNLEDGRVEALLEGRESVLKKAIEQLKKGPFLSNVRNIEVEWDKKEMNFKTFEVLV